MNIQQFWQDLAPRARWGLGCGVLLVAALTAWLAAATLRTDYQVMFADLAPQDSAAMVAEIERMKVPYRLDDGGTTILVPSDIVHKTRLKLISKDLPLHGTVGLELFNNTEIGMTEFAQKVNYQRAQQGELTRTILAVEEILAARVHLAIPESGLFRKADTQPKASVTLTLKPGKTLQPAQVSGIQRLVAAAVANIRPDDVTILDQHGVALTRAAPSDGEQEEPASAALDSKRSAEAYLNRKLSDMLDHSFGAGQSIASVDVVINHDRSKTTTEHVLPGAPAAAGVNPAGVVVRERQSQRDNPAAGAAGQSGEATQTSSETDYQVGRRVEQVVAATGGIRRLNVAVVVKPSLDAEQTARLKDLAALAVGLDPARGDGIAVYSMDQFAGGRPVVAAPAAAAPQAPAAAADPASPSIPADARMQTVLVVLLAGVLALTLLHLRRRRAAAAVPPALLDEAQRARLRAQIGGWIDLPVPTRTDPKS